MLFILISLKINLSKDYTIPIIDFQLYKEFHFSMIVLLAFLHGQSAGKKSIWLMRMLKKTVEYQEAAL